MAETKKTISPGTAGHQVTANLKRLREAQGLTYAELAKRLQDLGRPIATLGLRRIEQGDRRVDVEDLMALARALTVPPLLLLFPLGTADQIPIPLGQTQASTWDVARWFMGEGPFPSAVSGDEWARRYGGTDAGSRSGLEEWYDDPETGWQTAATPVLLMRRHQQQVADYQAVPRLLRISAESSRAGDDVRRFLHTHFKDMAQTMQTAAEQRIQATRAEIRRLGFAPPRLPEDLAHLDTDTPEGAPKPPPEK